MVDFALDCVEDEILVDFALDSVEDETLVEVALDCANDKILVVFVRCVDSESLVDFVRCVDDDNNKTLLALAELLLDPKSLCWAWKAHSMVCGTCPICCPMSAWSPTTEASAC